MAEFFYFLGGAVCGAVVVGVAGRALLHAGLDRARSAERRAAEAERLAELGSMTSGLAHEIKNPLSTVGLNAQLIEEGLNDLDLPIDDTAPLRRRVAALGREVARLREILTDFLQFAGQMRLEKQPHDLVALLEELADFFHPQAESKGILLRSDLPPMPLKIEVDEGLLKQAVLNLMLNAVQAMQGEGDLIVRLEADETEARIHIIDTGPGVPEDLRESIFHPYVSGSKGGTGLGLPTTRRIVEEHGGRLTLDVLDGQGSDFTIHLSRSA